MAERDDAANAAAGRKGRKAELGEALRRNLKLRKAQARARGSMAASEQDTPDDRRGDDHGGGADRTE